ncbi:50S ribosomal protein L24 [bacterium]|nr:MAG: 50S ribosomal protein L24 [bacterium]
MGKHLKIKKNDIVQIISGNDRGERGKVLKVYPSKQTIIVEGINFIKRHTKPTQKDPQGGIQEREAPIHISSVMLVCPNCGQPTRVGFHFMEDGTKVRVCRKCNEMIES